PVSPELLYHFNLGYPAIGPGTFVTLGDKQVIAPITMPEPGAPAAANCIAGGAAFAVHTPRSGGDFALRFSADVDTLPALQFWRDLRPRVGLFCVEPCTSLPGQRSLELAPGEDRTYRVTVGFDGPLVLP